jgi:hypothetical protein
MRNTVDFNFNYRFLIRQILIQKVGLSNNSSIPEINSIILFFSLKFIENVDSPENFNFFYFFRFFFGRTASVVKFRKNFKQGVSSYNYNIKLLINKNSVYSIFFFFLNDVVPFVERNSIFLQKKFFNKKRNHDFLFLSIKDVLIFSEKKGNIGLFDLKTPLNIKIFFNLVGSESIKIFLNNTKFFSSFI